MQAKLYSSGRARGLIYDPLDICTLAFTSHVSHLDCYLPFIVLEQFAVCKFFRQQMLELQESPAELRGGYLRSLAELERQRKIRAHKNC
jgi:hypothetical protein